MISMRQVEVEFLGEENTACRQDSSGKGSPSDPEAAGDDNKYFRKLKANQSECEEKCKSDMNCTGYEHNEEEFHCELWKVDIGYISTADGFKCMRKEVKDVEDEVLEPSVESEWESDSTKFEGILDTACRFDSSGKGAPDDPEAAGEENKYFLKTTGNEQECEDACLRDAACTGYEHNAEQKHCELWKMKIGFIDTAEGFICRRKIEVAKCSNKLAIYLPIILVLVGIIVVLSYLLYKTRKDKPKVENNVENALS